MAYGKLYKIRRIADYPFALIPKGEVFTVSMNPYNGNVFLELSNRTLSGSFAFGIMKNLVTVCRHLEQAGSDDPLCELMAMGDKERGELFTRLVLGIRCIEGKTEKVIAYGMKRKAS